MVAACLPVPRRPAVPAFVAEHSDGMPFLVEELLAGLVTSGALVRRGRPVAGRAGAHPVGSRQLRRVGAHPAAALDADARQVLAAAAVLGRRFDWELLPGVAAVDGAAAVESLRRAVDAQLVTVDGQRFRFRHALTREAVLAELLPPERVRAVGAGARRGAAGAPRACPARGASWRPNSPRPPATGRRPRRSRSRAPGAPWSAGRWPARS